MAITFTTLLFKLIPTLFLFLLFAEKAFSAPLRIMALGNSITQSNHENHSYRYNLWKKLIDAGVEADYVGSHNVHKNGNPQWPKYKGHQFDSDNEGHWGWSADQILAGNTDEPAKGHLKEWLKEYTPDIVLLHLGTNDMFRNQTIAGTLDEIREVVHHVRKDNPQAKIFLAKLIPAFSQKVGVQAADNIRLLNEKLPALTKELHTATSPVILVDQYTGFDPTTGKDTWDGVHPNASGEEKMAQKWFEAIMQAIQVVPVEYAAFEAELSTDNNVHLTWKTSSENGNDNFEVLRANQGEDFKKIGEIDGAGSSTGNLTYNYTDTTAPYGILKYKLKQISFDGSNSYSETVQVEKQQVLHAGEAGEAGAKLLQVFPTLSRDKKVTVQLQDQEPFSTICITIYTPDGKLLKLVNRQCSAEGTVTEEIRMRATDSAGLYLVRVTGSGQHLQRKFILTH
ncbi:GDSL-type esterase/lipase family protein [Pontibacter sp. MBLB2868]|uniref:GDSL-type esterase/lipase family protein n=1 Tax=Pontibacter sp. MBLB2868 TaxID=3451555 RepID=UPI003F7504C2